MDAKDLRTDSTVNERSSDGISKYTQSGAALQYERNKSYEDIGSNSLAKMDVQTARPCAVIGPDRVVPPSVANDNYVKKGPVEHWPCIDNTYGRPPEYPHKIPDYQHPTRNISPRQTFQENMPRIMVPPRYNPVKVNEDLNFPSDRNGALSKNIKVNMPSEAKYCDVPYTVNTVVNEPKNVRNTEMCMSNVNPALVRSVTQGWPASSINARPLRPYNISGLYPYPEYPSCAGQRPLAMTRPHRTLHEEPGQTYSEPYYHDGNIRFKPYPTVKERYPQARYEYISNYSNPYQPPAFSSHKYDLHKSIPPHPYAGYPQVPLKYLDSRMSEPVMDSYQRSNQQTNFNVSYHNQGIHPTYGPVPGNYLQSKLYSYPPDGSVKPIASNKLPYDNNNKMFIEYENMRTKTFPTPNNLYTNDISRFPPSKSQIVAANYSSVNMHAIPSHPYYRKDNSLMKNYDCIPQFRNMDINHTLSRFPSQFSPNVVAISPSDSNTSNDTTQTQGTLPEDCGYVSQSSTTSVRSMDSVNNRTPNDFFRRYDYRYGPVVRNSSLFLNSESNPISNKESKNKKGIDVRQFLQMWNEGDDDNNENTSKDTIIQTVSNDGNNFSKQCENVNNNEQLYVLGLVNVPSEELGKYEHIQKVSKLPENIKGYNNIELLNQFEEAIESSNINNFIVKSSTPKEIQVSKKSPVQSTPVLPRSVSPLDVEAKITQSVIHKEVGCNFEIKPCSPKMLNVEIATPVQTILGERVIEKVANPLIRKSPVASHGIDKNMENCFNSPKQQGHCITLNENLKIPSCKMINTPPTQYSSNDTVDPAKTNYSIQDFESSSGVCLASLPRLDNDIELNFPEVNQQFINANKVESVITTTLLKDLPTLDIDQTNNITKCKNELKQRSDLPFQHQYNIESETEFSKLSKYRKFKILEPNKNDLQPSTQILRTNSVIIKNPENINYSEGSIDTTSKITIDDDDIQQNSINLVPENKLHVTYIESGLDETEDKGLLNVEKDTTSEITKLSFNSSNDISNHMITQTNTDINLTRDNDTRSHQKQDNNNLCEGDSSKSFESPVVENLLVDNSRKHKLSHSNNEKDIKYELQVDENDQSLNMPYKLPTAESSPTTQSRVEKLQVQKTISEANTCNETTAESSTNTQSRIEKLQPQKTISKANACNGILPKIQEDTGNILEISEKEIFICKLSSGTNIEVNNEESVPEEDQTSACSDMVNNTPGTGSEANACNETTAESSTNTQSRKEKLQPKKTISEANACNEILPKIQDTGTLIENSEKEIFICKLSSGTNIEVNNEESVPEEDQTSVCSDTVNNTPGTEPGIIDINKNNNISESDKVEVDEVNIFLRSEEKCLYEDKEIVDPNIVKETEKNNDILVDEPTDVNINNTKSVLSTDVKCNNVKITREIEMSKMNNMSMETKFKYKVLEISDREHIEIQNSQNFVQKLKPINYYKMREKVIEMSTKCLLAKELFSPWIQNLILYNEGLYTEKSNLGIIEDTVDEPISPKLNTNIDIEETILHKLEEEIANAKDLTDIQIHTRDSERNDVDCDVDLKIDARTALNADLNNVIYQEEESAVHLDDFNSNCVEIDAIQVNTSDVIMSRENLKINFNLKTSVDLNKNVKYHTVLPDGPHDVDSLKVLASRALAIKIHRKETANSNYLQSTDDTDTVFVCDNIESQHYFNKNKYSGNSQLSTKRSSLKRSLSDSALEAYNNLADYPNHDSFNDIRPSKCKKYANTENVFEPHLITENFCNVIQTNRRNSISSISNEESVSYCILIDDNCIITEENDESDKNCFTSISENCVSEVFVNEVEITKSVAEEISSQPETNCEYDDLTMDCVEGKTIGESWIEDIACVETVVSDDVAENIIICTPTSDKDTDLSNYQFNNDETDILCDNRSNHMDKVKYIYGEMCNDDAQLVETLYRTPQMDVNKTLNDRESQIIEECSRYYDKDSLENILSDSNGQEILTYESDCNAFNSASACPSASVNCKEIPDNKENVYVDNYDDYSSIFENQQKCSSNVSHVEYSKNDQNNVKSKICGGTQDGTVCESSVDDLFTYNENIRDGSSTYTNSSSPEVSSTTSEEKSSSILLKITKYKGSRISQIADINSGDDGIMNCKFSEDKDYFLYSSNNITTPRPLITKAAQKYIPPLKESLQDLTVKLPLPQQSLLKLKMLKKSKEELKPGIKLKLNTCKNNVMRKETPKKVKPKFEDVLKSIDEIQFRMHKEKSKKAKKYIPKVVIKKNENGSHYASTSNKNIFNPDLTGRKWQPWVFLEKNSFIDKMALKKKANAVYSHRKKTYVLAEKFQKYKSISSTKFIISQPKLDESSIGQLKYTIRLKHS